MATMTGNKTEALRAAMAAHTGWHTSKSFDWDAFPPSRGYPELARAQMRYVGAGSSPKVDDAATLRPSNTSPRVPAHEPPQARVVGTSPEVAQAAPVARFAGEAEGLGGRSCGGGRSSPEVAP